MVGGCRRSPPGSSASTPTIQKGEMVTISPAIPLGISTSEATSAPLPTLSVNSPLKQAQASSFPRGRLYLPRGKELAWACFSGLLTLSVGNGALVASEVLIPSGIAGLIVTISPFWMVGVEALLPGGDRLHPPTIAGMAVGLAGAALLFTPDAGAGAIDHKLIVGFLLLQFGMAGWSFGSIIQR